MILEFAQKISNEVDVFASVVCLVSACLAVYLAQLNTEEKIPGGIYQKLALGTLAVMLFANSISDYPQWKLIGGHRPTGLWVNTSLLAVLLVMTVRARMARDQEHRDQAARHESERRRAHNHA